jgi:hypothetical protein
MTQDLCRDHESIEAFIARGLHQRPTPQTVVEAVWYCIRERGLAGLREPANITRLQTFDPAARAQLNERIAKVARQTSRTDEKMPPEPVRDYAREVLAEVPGTAEYKAAHPYRGAADARSGNGKGSPVNNGGGNVSPVEEADFNPDPHQPKSYTKKHHPPPQEPRWKQGLFTAEQLQAMEFPPTSFLVRDVIPAEGVTLLCSKPKFGKSWLVYDLCIGCTMNRFILGEIKPAQGDVLYLALEDSRRRLQRRMTKLLPAGNPWPAKLTLKTEWHRLHEGGLEDIRSWHMHTKNNGGKPILVVIDVLAKVRKPVGNKQLPHLCSSRQQ